MRILSLRSNSLEILIGLVASGVLNNWNEVLLGILIDQTGLLLLNNTFSQVLFVLKGIPVGSLIYALLLLVLHSVICGLAQLRNQLPIPLLLIF